MSYVMRWYGRRAMIAIGVLALLAARPVDGQPTAREGERLDVAAPARVQMRGERQWDYAFGPVYRRFARARVQLRQWRPRPGQRVLVAIERWDDDRPVDRQWVLDRRVEALKSPDADRVRLTVRFGEAERPVPVGAYRLHVWAVRDGRYQWLGSRRFYLIFNTTRPEERSVYHPHGERWLTSRLRMVQKAEGEIQPFNWRLGIHDRRVFMTAIEQVNGCLSPDEAAERLLVEAARAVEGYWPGLPDVNGRIPDGTPAGEDPDAPPTIHSVPRRLGDGDRRGQCFDVAAVSIALLRTVGIPAAPITVDQPKPMPHPYDPSTAVVWDYHVWIEFYLDGRWWAADVTYLDERFQTRRAGIPDPGPQRRRGRWFRELVGRRSRVWLADTGHDVIEATNAYRRN